MVIPKSWATHVMIFRKERSERRVFALFHFVSIGFLYLYCVSIDFCATERILFCLNPPPPPKAISKIPIFQNSNFPKFQFSKIPIFQKNQRNQKNQLCQDFASPPLPPMVCAELFFFVFLVSLFFFWKIGILENWNFGFFDFLGCFKFSISLEVDNTTTFSHFQNSL